MSRRVYVMSNNVVQKDAANDDVVRDEPEQYGAGGGHVGAERREIPVAVGAAGAGPAEAGPAGAGAVAAQRGGGLGDRASEAGDVELTDLFGTGPLFEVVRRGYDRLAVDGYVESMEAELTEARSQLHAMRERHRAAVATIVEARRSPDRRAVEILEDARTEADARLANVAALREAAQVAREEAQRDRAAAAAELADARAEAEALRREAREVRDAVTESATRRLREIQEEMADLRLERDEALSYLRRLTGQIESALQTLTAVLPDDASALTGAGEPIAG